MVEGAQGLGDDGSRREESHGQCQESDGDLEGQQPLDGVEKSCPRQGDDVGDIVTCLRQCAVFGAIVPVEVVGTAVLTHAEQFTGIGVAVLGEDGTFRHGRHEADAIGLDSEDCARLDSQHVTGCRARQSDGVRLLAVGRRHHLLVKAIREDPMRSPDRHPSQHDGQRTNDGEHSDDELTP